jgi:cation diffusion facilitator CzcD-associated flavoprotein CzcO
MRDFSAVEERSVDEARRLRVVIIGAGISGILACIRFRQRIPNLDICVYEKNADIGGTWFENRYPGCACGMSIKSPDSITDECLLCLPSLSG